MSHVMAALGPLRRGARLRLGSWNRHRGNARRGRMDKDQDLDAEGGLGTSTGFGCNRGTSLGSAPWRAKRTKH